MGFASGFAAGSAAVERGLSIKDKKEEKERKEKFQQRIKDINSATFEEIKPEPPAKLGEEPTGLGGAPADPTAPDAGMDTGLGGDMAPPPAAPAEPAPTRYSFLGKEYDSVMDDEYIQGRRDRALRDAALEYDVDVGLKYMTDTQKVEASKADTKIRSQQVDINSRYTDAQITNMTDRLGLSREQLEEVVTARETGNELKLKELGVSERRIAVEENRFDFQQKQGDRNYKLAVTKANFENAKTDEQRQLYGAQAETLEWKLSRDQQTQYGVELENAVEYLREGDNAGFNNFMESNQEIIQQTFQPSNGADYSSIEVLTDPAGTGGIAQFYDADGNRVGSDQFTYDELMSMAKSAQGITGRKDIDALTSAMNSTVDAIDQLDDPTSAVGVSLMQSFARMQNQVTGLLSPKGAAAPSSNTAAAPPSNTAAGQGVDIIADPNGGFIAYNRITQEGQRFATREEAELAVQGSGPVPMNRGLVR